MKEVWREIDGFQNYEVSNLGRIRSYYSPNGGRGGTAVRDTPQKILSQGITPQGYERVCLYNDGKKRHKTVHRIVARAFLGDPPIGKPIVCHIDGDRTNNAVTNLRYDNNSGNMLDKHVHGTMTAKRGEEAWNSKLTNAAVRKIRRLYKSGNYTQKDLANMFGMGASTISYVVRGKMWGHVK